MTSVTNVGKHAHILTVALSQYSNYSSKTEEKKKNLLINLSCSKYKCTSYHSQCLVNKSVNKSGNNKYFRVRVKQFKMIIKK